MRTTKLKAVEVAELGGLLILQELGASQIADLQQEREVRREDEVILALLTLSVHDRFNRPAFSEAHFRELRNEHPREFARLFDEVCALQVASA